MRLGIRVCGITHRIIVWFMLMAGRWARGLVGRPDGRLRYYNLRSEARGIADFAFESQNMDIVRIPYNVRHIGNDEIR